MTALIRRARNRLRLIRDKTAKSAASAFLRVGIDTSEKRVGAETASVWGRLGQRSRKQPGNVDNAAKTQALLIVRLNCSIVSIDKYMYVDCRTIVCVHTLFTLFANRRDDAREPDLLSVSYFTRGRCMFVSVLMAP